MKSYITLFLMLLCTLPIAAQNDNTSTQEIQAAIDACIAMRDAAAAGDTAAIRLSADALKKCQTSEFFSLNSTDDSIPSINGHLVFSETFADSLAQGKDVYQEADDINRNYSERSPSRGEKVILTKTCFVRAGKSAKYNFQSAGHQELAVVAEAGGLVTMKIHVTNSDGLNFNRDDTTSVHQGLPQRKTSLELPEHPTSLIELEIFNCGKKDCTFVVISN